MVKGKSVHNMLISHCRVKIKDPLHFLCVGWLVVLGFNTTLTAKVISWRSVMHVCFLAFSHQYQHNFSFQSTTSFLTCFCRDERWKYAGKKVRLNQGLNSQPPGHESDTFTTEGCIFSTIKPFPHNHF